jgi:hypothetical protein
MDTNFFGVGIWFVECGCVGVFRGVGGGGILTTNGHEWTRIFWGMGLDWLSVLVLGFFEGLVVGGFEPRMDTNGHEFFWGWNLIG